MRALVLAFALPALLVAPAHSSGLQLRADVQPVALRLRTNAPAFIEVRLNSHEPSILTGTLEISVMSGSSALYRQETPELALPPGVTTQRYLLPSTVENFAYRAEVQLRFVTRHGTVDLGRFPLGAEPTAARQYLIAVCGSNSAFPAEHPRLWQALRPERLFVGSKSGINPLNTVPVTFAPEDFPVGLGLCAFDVVVAEGPSFAALSGKQLASLAAWVEGGGSLCVVPRAPLDQEHIAFLNSLSGTASVSAPVTIVPSGPLSIEGGPLLLRRPGIGRLVVALNPPADEEELEQAMWRRAAAFLAKAQVASVKEFGATVIIEPAAPLHKYVRDLPSDLQESLFSRLPHLSRMIPFPVVAAILGAFVLLIGPGEWVILGRLRRRRWTWVTFPILATSFTFLAARTGEFYLGRDDKRMALIISDVGTGGKVLRENRIELLVSGHDLNANSELRQSISLPVHFSGYGLHADEAPIPPVYQGQVPAHYTLRRSVQQWRPAMQRSLTFGPAGETPNLHWPEIDAHQLSKAENLPEYFAQQIGGGWRVDVFQLQWPVSRQESPFGLPPFLHSFFPMRDPVWETAYSPSGNAELTDLPIHDPTNAGEWLVVAVKVSDNEIRMVRRLYHTDD